MEKIRQNKRKEVSLAPDKYEDTMMDEQKMATRKSHRLRFDLLQERWGVHWKAMPIFGQYTLDHDFCL